ncbi:hypothetical protein CATYP_07880 [Corynebacterium atypicum]|uniref:Uncharacterized protein n=1 Tax=Corynebacterium atypicum TaxID=191610 RepID=A0ABM5QNV7_9CORY|nr:hypothetical protein [Corynebacterium atypicum]AIG64521.1 hypothetical protein CATYP_07880 [Corynebacterium atypicum]
MIELYDRFAQALVAAPLTVQLTVLFLGAVPLVAAIAIAVLRGIDLAAVGRRKWGSAVRQSTLETPAIGGEEK